MLTAENVLLDRFGLQSFRPGQKEVIDVLMNRGSALAVFPTGGGKSMCYQLPSLLFDGVTVVVSPLIALMKDQIDFLVSKGVDAARLDSTLSLDESRDITQRLTNGTLKLLYVAPERFNNERFFAQLGRVNISLFAIDEAHCISEWGHNFRPDYLKLVESAKQLKVERVLALTATATPSVIKDICAAFNIPESAAIVTGFERPNLYLSTHPVSSANRTEVLIQRMKERPTGSSIVYVTLQATTEQVAKSLAAANLPARAYHAGMKDEERTAVQEWWKQSDKNIVVATIAFGMGIDKADVRYVYHYNLPKGLESYSQEIGRAGRDGEPSTVELLGGQDDVSTLENFAYGDTPTRESLQSLLNDILGLNAEFDVSTYALSNKHDMRPLVLRTAFTYLELLQVIKQGTPFYAGYKIRLNEELPHLLGRFNDDRALFLESIFKKSKFGREWYTIDPEQLSKQMKEPRDRVTKAINYIGEQGWAEVQVSDARQKYTRLVDQPDIELLIDDLMEKFQKREQQEARRVQHILDLITNDGCQTNFLLQYFGDIRTEPCGHCTFCQTKVKTVLAPESALDVIDQRVNRQVFTKLCQQHPDALTQVRQQTRFLCGLTSPALTRAKLTRHELFGALERSRFLDVENWLAP